MNLSLLHLQPHPNQLITDVPVWVGCIQSLWSWYTGLLAKVVRLKLLPLIITLIKFFQIRQQQYYSSKKILFCIVKDSSLGFTVFNLYINDIPLPTSNVVKLVLNTDEIYLTLMRKYYYYLGVDIDSRLNLNSLLIVRSASNSSSWCLIHHNYRPPPVFASTRRSSVLF